MGRELWDVIEMGEAHIFAVPSGARRVSKSVLSVGLPRRRFRRPRPVHWTEPESRGAVPGTHRDRRGSARHRGELLAGVRLRRRAGGDDALEAERYFVGEPQYIICPCCGSGSGVDDLTSEMVRQARSAWFERGRTWREPEERPDCWDAEAALAAL